MNGVQSQEARRRATTSGVRQDAKPKKGRGYGILNPKAVSESHEIGSSRNYEQGRALGRGLFLKKMAERGYGILTRERSHEIGRSTNREQGYGRGYHIKKMANTSDTTPLSKVMPAAKINNNNFAKCAFEETLMNIESGFAKIDLINAFPEQRYMYEHVVTDLSTHKEYDPLFF